MKQLALILVAAACLGFCACKSQTAIVVTVDTEGIDIPDMMDGLQVLVSSPDGAGVQKTLVAGSLGGMSGPYSVTILRTSSSVRSVLVKVRGLKGSKNIGDSDEVQITFKEGELVRRTINLNVVTGCQDADEDGFFVGLGCEQGIPTDCDDNDEFVYPGAPERCNGKDDDCDEFGDVDEDPDESRSGCPPRQGVCENTPITCVEAQWDCGRPPGYSVDEICEDDLDNNCDGQVNETCPCETEDQGKECGSNLGECVPGHIVCHGTERVCEGGQRETDEICDNRDNDCDGFTDEDFDVGDTCVVGLGMCQNTGTMQCQTSAPYLQECDATADASTLENCNDRETSDEDCDGSSNELDTDSCPLTETWAASCVWLYRTVGPTNRMELCGDTIQIPLNTTPPVVSGLSHEWMVIDQSCPAGFDCFADFTGAQTLHPTLDVTLVDIGWSDGTLSNITYTATVRLTFLQSGTPVGYYEITANVLFCQTNLCLGNNTQCDNTPPSQGGVITSSCSGYDG